jgi:hypothetical protein
MHFGPFGGAARKQLEVAKYFLFVKVLSRNRGSSVIRAAAYRAGERILESRTGRTHDFSSREDVVHKEVLLPCGFANDVEYDWARDRSNLWSVVDSNTRRNARLANEVLIILPPELNAQQRTELVRNYSQELANRYRNAVDFAVHEPRANADPRNHHAHLLMTAREVTPQGMGCRTALDGGNQWQTEHGLGSWREEFPWMRERWAQMTNEALRSAGLEARVDHRSFEDQGLNVESTAMIPQKIYYAERRTGVGTQAGDEIRAFHRERVEARAQGKEALDSALRRQIEQRRLRLAEYAKPQVAQSKQDRSPELGRARDIQRQREWRRVNGETYNQKRRERYKEKVTANAAEYARQRETLRSRQRELYRANIEVNRAKKRDNYANRKRRLDKELPSVVTEKEGVAKATSLATTQFPPMLTAEQSAKNWAVYREQQLAKEAAGGGPPTAEQSAKNWAVYREQQLAKEAAGGGPPTAEQSAKNWLAYRKRQLAKEAAGGGAPTAEQSAKNWLAYREQQAALQQDGKESVMREVAAEEAEKTQQVKDRSLDYDAGL